MMMADPTGNSGDADKKNAESSSSSSSAYINMKAYNSAKVESIEKVSKAGKRHKSHRLFALGLLATVFLLLMICANIRLSFADALPPMTDEELRNLCPNEKEFCYETAMLGNCFGKSLKAKVLANQCKCACESVQHWRIQNCCRTVGDNDMKFCLPLCGYNTTANELGSAVGLKCVSQLSTWAYCAADANDNTNCCKAKGVEDQCLIFCRGDVPTCDMQSIFSYQPCLISLKKIMECQRESLEQKPRFNPKWSPECDWENK